MTQVRIPPILRESAGGNKQVELEGGTVGDVLQQLVDQFPALRDQLFTADGELNRFVNVYLNEEDVRYLSELDTPAGGRDTIVVLPAMAGGAVHGTVFPAGGNTVLPAAGNVDATAGRWYARPGSPTYHGRS